MDDALGAEDCFIAEVVADVAACQLHQEHAELEVEIVGGNASARCVRSEVVSHVFAIFGGKDVVGINHEAIGVVFSARQ